MTVNRERMELWAQALESEKYVQCQGSLRVEVEGKESSDITARWHCALGVGMEVAAAHGVKVYPWDWAGTDLPDRVQQWYGLPRNNPFLTTEEYGIMSVTTANDRRQLPFWDIAQLLRAQYVKEES